MASYHHEEEKVAFLQGCELKSYACVETVDSEVVVKPLRYSEIPRAVSNSYTATRVESLARYLDDADNVPFSASRKKLLLGIDFAENVHRGHALTVNHGDANLFYAEPGEVRDGPLLRWLNSLLNSGKSAELRKRETEIGTKLRAMIKASLGDRIGSMMELGGLATAPAKQRRGYATALVKTVNDLADAHGWAVWLVTDDADWFYEELGYVLAAEDWVGVDNPNWKGDPVPLRIMVREPESVNVDGEKDSGLRDPASHEGLARLY